MGVHQQAESVVSELQQLEHREAELVRRLTVLGERRAFFPGEVSEQQVNELAGKLTALRERIDALAPPTDPHAL